MKAQPHKQDRNAHTSSDRDKFYTHIGVKEMDLSHPSHARKEQIQS